MLRHVSFHLSATTFLRRRRYHSFCRHFLVGPPKTFKSLLQVHALLITTEVATNPFIAAKLISLYSVFHHPSDSTFVFNSILPTSDAFLWNSVIQSHFSNGEYLKSLRLYSQMIHTGGISPTHFTFPMVASACGEIGDFYLGCSAHCSSIKLGILGTPYAHASLITVGSSFVYMYCKCGFLSDAVNLFDEMPLRDVVTWTTVITGSVNNGKPRLGIFWFREMLRDSSCVCEDRPNSRTVEACLKASTFMGNDPSENEGNNSRLIESKILHGFSIKTGTGLCCYVQSAIHSIYSKLGSVQEANSAFHESTTKDIVSWTAIVGVYARMGCVREVLQLFDEMTRLSDLVPDGVFLSCLISVFKSSSSSKKNCQAFHAVILRRKLGINNENDKIMVSNSLMKMYFELGLVESAKHVFQTTQCQTRTNEESLNLMLVEFAKLGPTFRSDCFEVFRKISSEFDFQANNSKSLPVAISLCSRPVDLSIGKSIHGHVLKLENKKSSATISNSILSMYGRCGRPDIAKKLFDSMEKHDIVTWNTLMSIYTNTPKHQEHALRVFDELHCRRIYSNPNPDRTTYRIALSACSSSADLTRGQLIHSYIVSESSERLDQDVTIRTGLIDMYSKCGNLQLAQDIFDSTHETSKDVVLWNTMISSYAIHGLAHEALSLFDKLEHNHLSNQQRYDPPDEVTFLAAMLACSRGGLIDQGKRLFTKMTDFYNLIPNCKHYACLVDMLGRSGDLLEAEKLCREMRVPDDGGTWGALLGACNVYGEVEIGERAGKRAIELDPCNHGYYVLLANLYGRVGQWSDVATMRAMMQRKGMTKVIGFSSS